MQELVPIVVGAVLAGVLPLVRGLFARNLLLALLCLAFGAAWSGSVGEQQVDPRFALIDALQVGAAYFVTHGLWQRAVVPVLRRARV